MFCYRELKWVFERVKIFKKLYKEDFYKILLGWDSEILFLPNYDFCQ